MKRFVRLYAALDATRATSVRLEALRAYFAEVPAADAAWAVYFLSGRKLARIVATPRLREWTAEALGLPLSVVEACYAHVGDLAETLALLWDRPREGMENDAGLGTWAARLQALRGADEATHRAQLLAWWQHLPTAECYLLNKLVTGSLRVGVSSGLLTRALAQHANLPEPLMAQRLMGTWVPTAEWLQTVLSAIAEGDAARDPGAPYPFCLASPLEAEPGSLGSPRDFLTEWKWDGIRAQVIRRQGRTFVWSRGEELMNGRFPEVEAVAGDLPNGCVLDGEILAWRDGGVAPFALLQRRIGRKLVGKKLLADAPVRFLAYDLLEFGNQDWRDRPLAERRWQLEVLAADHPALALSPRIEAPDWASLAALRETARERKVEGLMLKRLDSAYLTGRKRGAWWKWKIGALTVDTVLVYAQSGHGRRANLYTDYTLAVWDGPGEARVLVPVAKAYSGLTDAELVEMDRWIHRHTREKFGPVRSVDAGETTGQVFEIAFEGIQASPRHKSGIALRFPRIARWRQDKLAREADTLSTLKDLLAKSA